MKAFLSFGYYDVREQQLAGSPKIMRALLEDALRCLDACPGLALGGLLYTQEPACVLPTGVPSRKLRSGERARVELAAVADILRETGESDKEVMVLRPAQGAIHLDRLIHFRESLRPVPSALVVSAVKFTSLCHPMWNVQVADRRFLSYGSIRQPRNGERLVAPLSALCPELWEAAKATGPARGSQHLQCLFYDDQALYAARMDMLPEKGEDLVADEAVVCTTEPGAADGILSRLPVFQMSRCQALDVACLERMLDKLASARGETLGARTAEPVPARLTA
jgi:hypothetical protein